MKHFYLLGSLFLFLFLTNRSNAQLAADPFEVEYTIHYGSYDGVDLTGYVTYELFLRFDSPNNYLISIYGEEDVGVDCVQDPVLSTTFNFPCGLFQDESETAFGFQNNCLYNFGIPGFEASRWDSYITLGAECSSDPNCASFNEIGFCPQWIDAFEGPVNGDPFDGGSFFLDSDIVFATPGSPSNCSANYAGPDNRVKIGQFTSCGGWDACITLSYINAQGIPVSETNLCLEVPHPCIDFPLDTDPTVTNADCVGDQSIVVVEDGGFSTVDYSLYSGGTIGAGTLVETTEDSDNGLTLTDLAAGQYYITMLEATGCRDTTVVFTIVDPIPIVFDAELLQDVLCFGETTGEIEVTCSGGNGTLDFSVNGVGNNACGTILSNLPCGAYEIVATDDNGCTATETINITCPVELTYNLTSEDIPCFDYDNGVISGPISGGTGLITANLIFETAIIETQSATGTLNVNFDELDGGDYTVEVFDANGCGQSFDFTIVEPDPVGVTPTVVDASCFSFCDGQVTFEITGGTGPFIEQVFNEAGNLQAADALCAELHTYDIIDANGCSLTGEFTVNEPAEIIYSTNITNVSCFALCDGIIEVNDVSGGVGTFTYSISPGGVNCDAPCEGTQASFSSVCSGNYIVTITDETNCSVQTPTLVVGTPSAVVINLAPTNVSCFGFADGEVIVTGSGGTGELSLIPNNAVLPQTVGDLAPGTYTYTIADENGCEASDDVIITEPLLLTALIDDVDNVTCGGACDGRIFYTVQGGTQPYTYTLDPVLPETASTGVISALCAGTYTLIINDLNDCEYTEEVVINEPEPLEILVDLDAPTCTGMFDGSAVVVSTGGTGALTTTFSPVNLDVTSTIENIYDIAGLGEQTVNIILVDEVGCTETLELNILPDIITDMILTTFSSPESCWNTQDGTATVAVQNGNLPITYEWNDAQSQTTATAIGLSSNDTYSVRVTDDIGCTLTTTVFVEPTIGCFFITNAITPNGDGSNDTWILGGLEFFPQATVNVFNRWGQLVFESRGYAAPWDGRFRGELLPVADYYYVIEYDNTKEPLVGTLTIKY